MAVDIKAALSKPPNAAKFGAAFMEGYLMPAFGVAIGRLPPTPFLAATPRPGGPA